MREHNGSPQAERYPGVSRLYSTQRWVRRRRNQLKAEPLCRHCLAQGIATPAKVADHIIPHRGDIKLFWEGELQSLCKPHHSSAKQSEERRGFSLEIGLDGYPVDNKHPALKKRT